MNKKINQKKYLEALNFAFKLHSEQYRTETKIPYFFHLSSVSNHVIENGGDTDEAIAGLLHDAVEDQGGEKTLKLIKKKFGNKVKVGGSMISGKEFVCWYISYKNDDGYSTGLHYRQKTAEDDPYLDVDYRRVGKDYEKDREIKIFPIQLKDEAVNLFREYLTKTIK